MNLRRMYAYDENSVLEVDRTVLPDGSIHAELELETSQMSEKLGELRAILEQLEIPYSDEVIPKFKRFLKASERSSI